MKGRQLGLPLAWGVVAGVLVAAASHFGMIIQAPRSVLAGVVAGGWVAVVLLVADGGAHRFRWPPAPGPEPSAGWHQVVLRAGAMRKQARASAEIRTPARRGEQRRGTGPTIDDGKGLA